MPRPNSGTRNVEEERLRLGASNVFRTDKNGTLVRSHSTRDLDSLILGASEMTNSFAYAIRLLAPGNYDAVARQQSPDATLLHASVKPAFVKFLREIEERADMGWLGDDEAPPKGSEEQWDWVQEARPNR